MKIDLVTGAAIVELNSRVHPGLVALVDPQDYPLVAAYRWYPAIRNGVVYATRKSSGATVMMHRQIMGAHGFLHQVDHVNHDGLDNRRCNLRLVTCQQNRMNMRPRVGTSRFKGVGWHGQCRKWRARIKINERERHLGLFDTEADAARAYDRAAVELFGPYACLNYPASSYQQEAPDDRDDHSDGGVP